MKVKDIEIDKIKQLENIRLRIDEKDAHTLMGSIKQDGLLEPVGVSVAPNNKGEYLIVYGNRQLGWKTIPAVVNGAVTIKDFVIKNTLENVERKDISESELGRIFSMLRNDYDMTNSEIASRFGFSAPRVKKTINIFLHIPEEYRDKVKYGMTGMKRGNISAGAADKILTIRRNFKLNKADIRALLEASKRDGFTQDHFEIVASLLKRGYSVDDAINMSKDYVIINVKAPVLKSEIDAKRKKYKRAFSHIVTDILSGKVQDTLDIPTFVKKLS